MNKLNIEEYFNIFYELIRNTKSKYIQKPK